MRLAFCLFKYFPYGGLQRDFMRIARVCLQRGHSIDVYTMQWEGDCDPRLNLHVVTPRGIQNHTQREDFVTQVQLSIAAKNYDLVVGFNKMPGLDVYYAADTCYQAKARTQHGLLYRLTKRYRLTKGFEQAVFSQHAATEILLIAPAQQQEFMRYYATPAQRFHILPPGIDKDRMAPPDAADKRAELRKELEMHDDNFLLLMVGSGFKTKGLDRALNAFAALPDHIRKRCHLFVIGKDNPKPFQRQAGRLDIQTQLHFLGGRDDVPNFYLAADLLLHPAYNENTGTVLLEALAGGLPVIATDVCGYAHYIAKARGGAVLTSPFDQAQLNKTLATMLLSPDRPLMQKSALEFAQTADIYSMPERAATMIESLR
jgi:UDP-glucose:(heptosyl)LPS alpha-1,3-glucosyltransferase